jgi:hypothetical protein
VRENVATADGRALGTQLARFCQVEIDKGHSDNRCSTCAFRAGGHLANGSPETTMSALKCVLEREPFWCHQSDKPCAGWLLLRTESGTEIEVPWQHVEGGTPS